MAKKDTTAQAENTPSYFQQRMDLLGITPDVNKIALHRTELQTGRAIMEDIPIFSEVPEGIKILVYTLDRLTIRIEKNGSRMKDDYALTRLKDPIIKGNDVIKYRIPKGGGTHPFFPPALLEKFEKKIAMKTVYLTEGYFKAFKASLHGLDIIGLSSITHMKDKTTGALHADIITLIKSGLVDRFVWLTDGDCLDITSKEITEDKDLYTRPRGFFQSVTTFKTLLEDYENVEKWFMHIDTDNIMAAKEIEGFNRDMVKGLDDLLITYKGREQEIIAEMGSFSGTGYFFKRFNITYGTHKVWQHFHLSQVNDFFLFHADRRPELKTKEFKFIGTRYKYNDEKSTCEVMIPGEANLYFRVGDDYYKWIEKPNQYQQTERVISSRQKSTITDDHGKNFTKHVPKYEAFCNVPDHNNFQQIIHNCFNVYSPLDHQPDEDECFEEDFPAILNMVKHLFGSKPVHYTDPKSKEKKEYKTWELGMDYLQMLYQRPQQKLPILCLVSKENNTGKSTMGFFLREMLGANTAIVGNADLAGDFNAHWATKSVVVCDETKIDKQNVIEKIKALSTGKKIFMNAKGKGQVELDCFIKFLLITNNEDNFIYASEDDIRYWIIKVPQLTEDDPKMLAKLVEEIPAFLSFLNRRKLLTEERSRMWFHPELLKTEALRKVIQFSQPTVEKEMRQFFRDMFLDTGLDEIMMTMQVVHKEVFNNKYERNYVQNVLTNRLKVQPYHKFKVDDIEKEYETEEEAVAAAEVKYPELKGHMVLGKIKPYYKVIRYSYPRYDEVHKDGGKEKMRIEVKEPPGRPYVFKRKDFVNDGDVVDIGRENKFLASVMDSAPVMNSSPGDLPFPTN